MAQAKALVFFITCQCKIKTQEERLTQPATTAKNNQLLAKQKNMSNMSLRLNRVEIQLLNISLLCQISIEKESLFIVTL